MIHCSHEDADRNRDRDYAGREQGPMTYYATAQVRALLNRGPHADEDFFRVKITGDGETRWFNVSSEMLEQFAQILESDKA